MATSDILQIGLSGLRAASQSLATISHNIANAHTEGYSRQRAELTDIQGPFVGNAHMGGGVQVETVRRVYDGFLTTQVFLQQAGLGEMETLHRMASHLDNFLGDDQAGLSPALDGFFSSLQDLADAPSSMAVRQAFLGEAAFLVDRFHAMDGQFETLAGEVDASLRQTVDAINDLSQAIARLNRDIVQAQGQGRPPNDLLDQRDALLKQLSEHVRITTVSHGNGSLDVFIGNGQSLVLSGVANTLAAVPSPYAPERLEVALDDGAGQAIISPQLSGGDLGGLLAFRKEVLAPARNALGRLAIVLGETFNAQHRKGMDLDGGLGGDVFAVASPAVKPSSLNTGTASVTVGIQDATALTTSDYLLAFDGSAWSLRRLDGQVVPMTGSGTGADPFLAEGLSITVGAGAGAGDSFLIQPTRQGAREIGQVLTDPARLAAASPLRAASDLNNLGDARLSLEVKDEGHPDLLHTVRIAFTSDTIFDVVDDTTSTVLASGLTYSEGMTLAFNGWEAVLSGRPRNGDTLTVEANGGGVGDNRNALLLGRLQGEALVEGKMAYRQAYGMMVAEVGGHTRRAALQKEAQAAVLERAKAAREAVSGVNLDEEAADMLRFQQAYQAAAQVIRVADEMFHTLLQAMGR